VYKDQPYFPPRWENAPAFPANMAAVWDRHFGSVQKTTGRAVVIGEVHASPDFPAQPHRTAKLSLLISLAASTRGTTSSGKILLLATLCSADSALSTSD